MTGPALQYHDATIYDRHNMSGHFLDWTHQPNPYKEYPGIDPLPLPREVQPPQCSLSAILRGKGLLCPGRDLGLEDLSLILHLTCTFTAKAGRGQGDFLYRSAASAGALFPTELYVANHRVRGLSEGLYCFSIRRHGLVPLRRQDLTPHVARLTGLPGGETPRITFFFTAIFFRSTWKYRDRAYRYHLLDTGHVMENMALALGALGLPYRLSYDFDDHQVNRLLGLDEGREVALGFIQIPGTAPAKSSAEGEISNLPEAMVAACRVSAQEVDYPRIREIHLAGEKHPPEIGSGVDELPEPCPTPVSWEEADIPSRWPEVMDYAEALRRRRSRRNFLRKPLKREAAMALAEALCLPGATAEIPCRTLSVGFTTGNVEDMEPGLYLLNRDKAWIGKATPGSFTERMAGICLDQMWLANAGVHFLFLTDPAFLDRTWGARGYRYAMMSAGRMGQRLYLAATALGLGCCGIGAFYDREAAQLLGLNRSSRLLYLVAVGEVKKT